MQPPGFGRPVRPATDLREFVGYLGEVTATRIGHILVATGVILAGVNLIRSGSWWGSLVTLGGILLLLGPAWFFYYRLPERESPMRGEHTAG